MNKKTLKLIKTLILVFMTLSAYVESAGSVSRTYSATKEIIEIFACHYLTSCYLVLLEDRTIEVYFNDGGSVWAPTSTTIENEFGDPITGIPGGKSCAMNMFTLGSYRFICIHESGSSLL
jgi:hypothetical protein